MIWKNTNPKLKFVLKLQIRPELKSLKPICFSVSAKKDKYTDTIGATSTPGSRAQHALFTNSVNPTSSKDFSWYTTGNKEVYF